jgi:hypothetical protein
MGYMLPYIAAPLGSYGKQMGQHHITTTPLAFSDHHFLLVLHVVHAVQTLLVYYMGVS